jgi:hypothetical protein
LRSQPGQDQESEFGHSDLKIIFAYGLRSNDRSWSRDLQKVRRMSDDHGAAAIFMWQLEEHLEKLTGSSSRSEHIQSLKEGKERALQILHFTVAFVLDLKVCFFALLPLLRFGKSVPFFDPFSRR